MSFFKLKMWHFLKCHFIKYNMTFFLKCHIKTATIYMIFCSATATLPSLSPPFTSLPPNCVKFSFVSIVFHYSPCPSLLLKEMIIFQLQGTTTMHQQHRHAPPRFQTTTSHHTSQRFQTATSYHTPLVIPRQ